jgi:hypothetical protein
MDTLKNLSFSLFVLFFFSHPVFASPTQNWIESKGEHFQSIRELEDEWRNYLEKDIEP